MEGMPFFVENVVLIAFAATIVWVGYYAKCEIERR